MIVNRNQITDYMLSLYPEFDDYDELKTYLADGCGISDDFFINDFVNECIETAEDYAVEQNVHKETLGILNAHNCRFASYFAGFISVHYSTLYSAAETEGITDDAYGLVSDIICRIYQSLYNIGIRVLISELENARTSGKLCGDTPAERFEYYSEVMLTDEEYLSELHGEYRLMYTLLTQTALHTARFARDIIVATARHRDEIAEKLCYGKEIGSLRYILLSGGDCHKDCRSVTVLGFDNAKVVYKPHSLDSEMSFQQLVEQINGYIGGEAELRRLRMICGEGYGFTEFIEHKESEDINGIRTFYKKAGILMGMLYVCNMSDCHFENIIACGNDPVLIDTETIFHCLLPDVMYAEDKESAYMNARYFLNKSVGSIGLLPSYISVKKDNGVSHFNFGGMSGSSAQEAPVMSYRMDDTVSDNMKLLRSNVRIESSCNAPILNGMEMGPEEFAEDIASGFTMAYRAISSHKEEFTAKVLSLYSNSLNRVVLKATMIYSNLLSIANHPDFLGSEVFARFLFSRAGLIRTNINISDYETTSLLSRTIPIYYADFSKKHIVNGNGTIYKDALDRSPMEEFLKKMDSLSETDLSIQLHMIASGYFGYNAGFDHCDISFHSKAENIADKESLLETAVNIGDYLIEQRSVSGIERCGKRGRFFFGCSVERCDYNDFSTVLTGSDLYNGSCGIALFLYYLGKISGQKRFTDACYEALETVKITMKSGRFDFEKNTGAFTGISGSFYVLSKIAEDSDDDEIRGFIKAHLHYISEFASGEERKLDLIAGTSGAIAVLLSIVRGTSDHSLKLMAVAEAEKCFEILYDSLLTEGRPDVSNIGMNGFSHGITGVIPYIYQLYLETGSEKALSLFRELLDYERSVFCIKQDGEITGWYANKESKDVMISWCHGIPGVLLEKLMLRELGYSDSLILSETEASARLVRESCIGTGVSYCHGDLGNLSVLRMYAEFMGDKELMERCSSTFEELHRRYLCGIERKENVICQKFNGLMVGLSGVGYACLNELDRSMPSFLRVE